jgi:MinD-like ATPase involved in chromosome partitioning or flagellar assembly
MSKTILVHSFRHGVGRSSIAVNFTVLLAAQGYRVAIIDTDTEAPVTHRLFGLDENMMTYSFRDYLQGKCSLVQAAYDVTSHLAATLKGQIFLVPANTKYAAAHQSPTTVLDTQVFNESCQNLIQSLKLDALVVDTQPGVSHQALVALPISDVLVIILRLDQRDYQGTSITMDLVRKLNIPRVALIVNEAPLTFDFGDIKNKIEKTYDCRVAAVLPYVEEVMALGNRDIFALRYPQHHLTKTLQDVAANLMT